MKYTINKIDSKLISGIAIDNYIVTSNEDLIETEEIPNKIVNIWNGQEWIEGATLQEIQDANAEAVPNEVKSINFLVQLELEGVTEAGILAIIDTLPEPNKTIARVSFKRATFFERDNALLLLVGQEYGFDSNKLDEIFINANKLPI